MEVETFSVLPLLRSTGDPGLTRDQGNVWIKVAVLHPLAGSLQSGNICPKCLSSESVVFQEHQPHRASLSIAGGRE